MIDGWKEKGVKSLDITNNVPYNFSREEVEPVESQANIPGKERVEGSITYQILTLLEIS